MHPNHPKFFGNFGRWQLAPPKSGPLPLAGGSGLGSGLPPSMDSKRLVFATSGAVGPGEGDSAGGGGGGGVGEG